MVSVPSDICCLPLHHRRRRARPFHRNVGTALNGHDDFAREIELETGVETLII